MKKFFSLILVLFIVVLLSGCNKQEEESEKNTEKQVNQKTEEQLQPNNLKETNISNWQTYRNEEFGFEVRYPSNWKLEIESSNPNKKLDDSFYFIKSRNQEEKVYFAVLVNGGFGYGTPELKVTRETFKGKEAEFFWNNSSDLPIFIKIKSELPKNWSQENIIEIADWNNSKEKETLREVYESFKFL